jgi:hypothetical protein
LRAQIPAKFKSEQLLSEIAAGCLRSELEVARPALFTDSGTVARILWLDERCSCPVDDLRLPSPLGFSNDQGKPFSELRTLGHCSRFGAPDVIWGDGLNLVVREDVQPFIVELNFIVVDGGFQFDAGGSRLKVPGPKMYQLIGGTRIPSIIFLLLS